MKISFHTVKDNLDTTRGYGAAGFRVVRSLQELGHEVPFDDSSAEVQISFCAPHMYKFHEGQYKIGYTPWESTELPHGWLEKMNECDEVWATSEWVANVYRAAGVVKPIFVYEHGLDEKWKPKERELGDTIKFLHVGEPALRKGGQMAVDAFLRAFGDRSDVHLTVKAYHQHYLRLWHDGKVVTPDKAHDNISIIDEQIPFSEMIEMYYEHDVLIYPSYGEGFGFIPLQGLGTGMPVISTTDWAPYAKYLQKTGISSRVDRSIWSMHPGDVFYPNYDELTDRMLELSDRDFLSARQKESYQLAKSVHDEYNWLRKTEEAFEHIVTMFTKP